MMRANSAIFVAAAWLVVTLASIGATEAARVRKPVAVPKAEVTERHVQLKDRTLSFTSSVGIERIALGSTTADVGVIALTKGGRDLKRPVTFVLGGGPGTSSAFLNIGALGPWRIDFGGGASSSPPLTANPDTWLDFTDLVFVDPPGVGQGRLRDGASGRDSIWSVEGDITLIADAVTQWIDKHHRRGSPVVLLGQSYGGFRVPRLADALRRRGNLSASALILVSPILDYGWRYQGRTSPLPLATLLPSFAAARMEAEGKLNEGELGEVEAYAAGPFIADYLRGPSDVAAIERLVRRVTAITGLSLDVVRAARGRVDEQLYAREIARANSKIASSYDATIFGADPDPAAARLVAADPFLAALRAPLASGMSAWLVRVGARNTPYVVASDKVFDDWDWGHDGGLPEAVTTLRTVLALDPRLKVLVAHGLTDLQTPYFETKLILEQLGDLAARDRIQRYNYRGGHMFYSRPSSRAAFRADAEKLYRALGEKP